MKPGCPPLSSPGVQAGLRPARGSCKEVGAAGESASCQGHLREPPGPWAHGAFCCQPRSSPTPCYSTRFPDRLKQRESSERRRVAWLKRISPFPFRRGPPSRGCCCGLFPVTTHCSALPCPRGFVHAQHKSPCVSVFPYSPNSGSPSASPADCEEEASG